MNDSTPWLERELARQLAPVTAPETLWNGIRRPRAARRDLSFRWALWPGVALLILAGCMGWLLRHGGPSAEKLTAQDLAELAKSPRDLDFRSSDFVAARAWVKAEANIDIDTPPGPPAESPQVRVLGVRLLHFHGVPVAAMDYRVGDRVATLVVCGRRAGPGGNSDVGRHLFSGMNSRGASLVSWNMRSESYAIFFPGGGDVHGACLLCHANMPGVIAIN